MVLFTGFIIECIVLYYKYVMNEPFSQHIALLMLGIMLIVIGIHFFSIGLLGELMTRRTPESEKRIKNISNK